MKEYYGERTQYSQWPMTMDSSSSATSYVFRFTLFFRVK